MKQLINNQPKNQREYWTIRINMNAIQLILTAITIGLVIYYGNR